MVVDLGPCAGESCGNRAFSPLLPGCVVSPACSWGGVLSNDPLDVYRLACLPPSPVLLTHAASPGSALTSVSWDAATWQ